MSLCDGCEVRCERNHRFSRASGSAQDHVVAVEKFEDRLFLRFVQLEIDVGYEIQESVKQVSCIGFIWKVT